MTKRLLLTRVDRANQMIDALKVETDRGQACVGDALLDEVVKDLFRKGFIEQERDVNEILGDGHLLGNHGARLKVAYLLGWIGPDTYADCRTIHKIRNRMAHNLDVDTFDRSQVKDLINQLKSPQQLPPIRISGVPRRPTFNSRGDRFRISILFSLLRCWRVIDDRDQAKPALDPPIDRSSEKTD